jgi:hypothetical protein
MNSLRTVHEARINFLFFQDIITCVMGILILATLILSLSLDTGEAATAEETQLQSQLNQTRQSISQIEEQNRNTEKQRLALASLPDRATLETELALLRQQATNAENQVRQSIEISVGARSQAEKAAADRRAEAELETEISALRTNIVATRDELSDSRRRTNSVYIVPAPDTQQTSREPVAFVVSGNKIEVKWADSDLSQTHPLSAAEDFRALLRELDPAREYVVLYFRPSGTKWFEPFRKMTRALGFAVGYDAIEEQKDVIFSTK